MTHLSTELLNSVWCYCYYNKSKEKQSNELFVYFISNLFIDKSRKKMGFLTVLKKMRQKEKEMRILLL